VTRFVEPDYPADPAERFAELADLLEEVRCFTFIEQVVASPSDSRLLWNTPAQIWVDADYPTSAGDRIPSFVPDGHERHVANLRNLAALYRQYAASGCEVRGGGPDGFSAWLSCGPPESPEEWDDYLRS
jgi:hypothetical protein